jgi:hypothetical protein
MSSIVLVKGANPDSGSGSCSLVGEATLDVGHPAATTAHRRDEELANGITTGWVWC